MRHVIIDTDPGVDDALALMLAFSSPELVVEAVTTVAGNVSQEKAHRNALKMLEFLGVSDIPVAQGASKPLLREAMDAEEFHGETGLGDAVLPEPGLRSDERPAVELIVDKTKELGGGLTLVAIGPLTNIASAIIAEPRMADAAAGLIIMGGAFHVTPYGHGNVTPVAEFNIWHDPEAAKIVFDSGLPVTAVGLDVTTHPDSRLSKSHLEEMEKLGTRRARLAADLCRGPIQRFGSLSLHDPMAVAAALDPSLAETERFAVDVETVGDLTRGQTVADRRGPRRAWRREANVDVCVSFEGERFLGLFMGRVVHG
ncbi:MAG: nucleoside hydrolase [Candidatus Bathyarchaeota archaeon]|nr:nucleoside hydrolase [Candidatus Bathyarchaeota archaeon]